MHFRAQVVSALALIALLAAVVVSATVTAFAKNDPLPADMPSADAISPRVKELWL